MSRHKRNPAVFGRCCTIIQMRECSRKPTGHLVRYATAPPHPLFPYTTYIIGELCFISPVSCRKSWKIYAREIYVERFVLRNVFKGITDFKSNKLMYKKIYLHGNMRLNIRKWKTDLRRKKKILTVEGQIYDFLLCSYGDVCLNISEIWINCYPKPSANTYEQITSKVGSHPTFVLWFRFCISFFSFCISIPVFY